MTKLICLAMATFLAFCVGCGPAATDTSGAAPPQTQQDTQKELEDAVKSGKIDPNTYGKQ